MKKRFVFIIAGVIIVGAIIYLFLFNGVQDVNTYFINLKAQQEVSLALEDEKTLASILLTKKALYSEIVDKFNNPHKTINIKYRNGEIIFKENKKMGRLDNYTKSLLLQAFQDDQFTDIFLTIESPTAFTLQFVWQSRGACNQGLVYSESKIPSVKPIRQTLTKIPNEANWYYYNYWNV